MYLVCDAKIATTSGRQSRVVESVVTRFGFELVISKPQNTVQGPRTSSTLLFMGVAAPSRIARSPGYWRVTTDSTTRDWRPDVVANFASHTKYINLVVHDGGVAFYNESDYADVEITGCLIYNNGWQSPRFGDGHALYLRSLAGPVVARDNIMFNQFGYGMHVYTDSAVGGLAGITLDGNVSFNNGSPSLQYAGSNNANLLIGGGMPVTASTVRNNMTYFSPGISRS